MYTAEAAAAAAAVEDSTRRSHRKSEGSKSPRSGSEKKAIVIIKSLGSKSRHQGTIQKVPRGIQDSLCCGAQKSRIYGERTHRQARRVLNYIYIYIIRLIYL